MLHLFSPQYYNDDGVWLRLNVESIMKYCSKSHFEAWCLQYNQHLGKTLLFPVDELKNNVKSVVKEVILRKRTDVEEYVLIINKHFPFFTLEYLSYSSEHLVVLVKGKLRLSMGERT